MRQYSVVEERTREHVAGPYETVIAAHTVANALGRREFRVRTWVGFDGTPALACVMRRVGDLWVLETACLYRLTADRICAECGGEEEGYVVRQVIINSEYPDAVSHA